MIKKLKESLKSYKKAITNIIKNVKLPPFIFIFGFFGAYAGSHGTSKNWRRLLLPAVSTLYALLKIRNFWAISIMVMSAFLSMGYGVPNKSDKGAALARFWFRIFKENHLYCDIFTRGSIGLGMGLTLLSIPILTGNWLLYFLGSIGIILSQAIISWRPWGSKKVTVKGKEVELCFSDIYNYSLIGLCIYCIITFKIL